jgi:hypothetical protein
MDAATSSAGDGRVNVQVELRWLKARVAALERAQTPVCATVARSGRRKPRYADITAEEHLGRLTLWSHYEQLKRVEAAGKKYRRRRGESSPWTKEWFVAHATDAEGLKFDRREFMRWFADRNTHRTGSWYDRRISAALMAAIADMIAAGVTLSHGI